jgi:hypothetical protein
MAPLTIELKRFGMTWPSCRFLRAHMPQTKVVPFPLAAMIWCCAALRPHLLNLRRPRRFKPRTPNAMAARGRQARGFPCGNRQSAPAVVNQKAGQPLQHQEVHKIRLVRVVGDGVEPIALPQVTGTMG